MSVFEPSAGKGDLLAAGLGSAKVIGLIDGTFEFGAATWPYWLCAVVVTIAVVLLLLMGMIAAGIRRLWRLGSRAADAGDINAAAATRPPPDSGAA